MNFVGPTPRYAKKSNFLGSAPDPTGELTALLSSWWEAAGYPLPKNPLPDAIGHSGLARVRPLNEVHCSHPMGKIPG